MDAAYIGVMIAVIFAVPQCQATIVMRECMNGRLSITEGKREVIACTDVPMNEPVTWTIRTHRPTNELTLGTCSSTDEVCSSNGGNRYGLSRLNTNQADESYLTILDNHREMFSETPVKCAAANGDFADCTISVIHPATASACNVYNDNGNLNGSCRVDEAFSSDGSYSCQWHITHSNNVTVRIPSVLIVTAYYNENGTLFYRGVCSFSYPLPDKSGAYTLHISMPSGPSLDDVGTFTMQDGTFQTSLGGDKSRAMKITVPAESSTPIILLCGAGPDTQRPYSWSGVTCTGGNNNQMCAFTPSALEVNASCTATLDFQHYSNMTVATILRIMFNYSDAITSSPAGTTTSSVQTTSRPDQSITESSPMGDNRTSQPEVGTRKSPQPHTSDNGDSLPVGAIGGGVVAVVVVIIVVVVVTIIIWKRRSGSNKEQSEASDHDLEEHHNIAYEPGDSPYEVSDAYQPAAGKSTAQKHRVDPTYEDSNLTSQNDDPSYTSPDNGRRSAGYTGLASGSGIQVHPEPLMDDGLYTSVDNPTPGDLAAAPESSTLGDEYAVVDKSKKTNKQSYAQPKPAASGELYAQVNKSRPAPGGDVYAQVDKSSKRANPKPTRENNVAETEDGNYAEVQKPKPDLKPKPALKPKPTCAVKPSPRDSSGSLKTSGGDDEYNVLTFQGRNSDTPANPDAGQLYSHIGSEI